MTLRQHWSHTAPLDFCPRILVFDLGVRTRRTDGRAGRVMRPVRTTAQKAWLAGSGRGVVVATEAGWLRLLRSLLTDPVTSVRCRVNAAGREISGSYSSRLRLETCGNGFHYSQSLPFPQGPSHSHSRNLHIWKNHFHSRIAPDNSFPFPSIPIPASTFRLIIGLPKTKWAKQHTCPH